MLLLLRILICLSVLFSFTVSAGKITIEKSDSLIRNDIFDQKREKVEQYKEQETLRNLRNEVWLYRLPPDCGLLRHYYLIYRCTDGRYFKGNDAQNNQHYRQLSELEVKKLSGKSE